VQVRGDIAARSPFLVVVVDFCGPPYTATLRRVVYSLRALHVPRTFLVFTGNVVAVESTCLLRSMSSAFPPAEPMIVRVFRLIWLLLFSTRTPNGKESGQGEELPFAGGAASAASGGGETRRA